MYASWRGRGRRALLALASAGLLSATLASAAFAWPPAVDGRPAGFQAGAPSGYYIWHTDDRAPHWHVELTDPPGVHHTYSGRLTTDGKFVGVSSVRLEARDGVRLLGDATLEFRFETADHIDGVDFSIDGGTWLQLALASDGAPVPPAIVNLGRASVHPPANPVVLWR